MTTLYFFVGDFLYITGTADPIFQSYSNPDFMAYLDWCGLGNVADVLDAAPDPADARARGAKGIAFAVGTLHNATPAQVDTYIVTQVSNNVAPATALAAINAIPTTNVAAAVSSIKQILTSMVNAQYAMMALLQLEGKIDIAFRDAIWPDMADLTEAPAKPLVKK